MEDTSEQFTLTTLGKFYTDAAEAGGMEVLGYDCWHHTEPEGGPRCGDRVADWRPKPSPPIVRYAIKNTSGLISTSTFHTAEAAEEWNKHSTQGVVIKLVEEI